MKKKFLPFLFIGLAVFVFVGRSLEKNQAEQIPTAEQSITATASAQPTHQPLEVISFTASQSGQTAFELLEKRAEIEFTDYGQAGKFVNSINGLTSDDQHFWAFYLNGDSSQTGASQTQVNEGDLVEFKYETIEPGQ